MKKIKTSIRLGGVILFFCFPIQQSYAQFQYINPMPGSKFRNPETAILLRSFEEIDPISINQKDLITIIGSKSGKHNYTLQLAANPKNLIVIPEIKFDYDEEVKVYITGGISTVPGRILERTIFSFKTRKEYSAEEAARIDADKKTDEGEVYREKYFAEKLRDDTPPAFTLEVDTAKVFNGSTFFGTKDNLSTSIDKFLCILNNDGTYTWTKNVDHDGANFKLDKNGYMTYYKNNSFKWYMIDSNFNLVDSFQCKNGYEEETNYHEFQIFPDGHKFLLAYHYETVDLTSYGGLPNAIVKFPVIQEQDADDNVVFEWASWDHFELTEATFDVVFTTSTIDPYHTNSIELDNDGNLLISSRYLDEITKIDRQTGNIIWRMGGEKNQFTFVNDPLMPPFSHQHDIRRLANGNVTLFDNGNLRTPQVSYVKEYSLDEENKIATLVWSYKHPPVNGVEVFSVAQGNAQRLPNGNTLINYAQLSNFDADLPSATEVTATGDIAWEITFTEDQTLCYRMHKYAWSPCARVTDYTLSAASLSPTKEILSWGAANGAIQYKIQYRIAGTSAWQTTKSPTTHRNIKNLQPGTSYEWRLKTLCAGKSSSTYTAIHVFQTSSVKAVLNITDDRGMQIYPNPAGKWVHLKFLSGKIQEAKITLSNMHGSEISSRIHLAQEGENDIELNLKDLSPGIYLVTLQMNDEKRIGKLLKQ